MNAAPTVPRPLQRPLLPFTVGTALRDAGATFKQCYPGLLAVSAVSIAIGLGVRVLGAVLPLADVVLSVLVEWPLYPGVAYVGITAVRERVVRVEDMFLGFRCYGRSLLLGLLVLMIVLATLMPSGAIVALVIVLMGMYALPPVLIVVAAIPLLVAALLPMLYVTVRLGLAYGMIADPVAGRPAALDALARSWSLTRGYGWPLVGLSFIMFFVGLGSLLLLCVGYLFLGAPMLLATAGASYWLILGDRLGHWCLNCGYDITGSPSPVCPECGYTVEAAGAIRG